MFFLWRKLGRAALAVELGALGGAYYVFHSINTSEESRRSWDARAPWLIDAFYSVTGNPSVIAHREAIAVESEARICNNSDEAGERGESKRKEN